MRTITLALTKPECRILARLARLDLAATIHVAMTAELPARNKTNYALGKVDAYLAVQAMLTWGPEDRQHALRSIPVGIMDYLITLVNEANTKTMNQDDLQEFMRSGPDLIANLEKARTHRLGGGNRPMFTVSGGNNRLDS